MKNMEELTDLLILVKEDFKNLKIIDEYLQAASRTVKTQDVNVTWRTIEAYNIILQNWESTETTDLQSLNVILDSFDYTINHNSNNNLWSNLSFELGNLIVQFLSVMKRTDAFDSFFSKLLSTISVVCEHNSEIWDFLGVMVMNLFIKKNFSFLNFQNSIKQFMCVLRCIQNSVLYNFALQNIELLCSFSKLVQKFADFELQQDIVDIVYIHILNDLVLLQNFFLDDSKEVEMLVQEYENRNFEEVTRKILNVVNKSVKGNKKVFTISCNQMHFGGFALDSPDEDGDSGVWMDANVDSKRLAITCANFRSGATDSGSRTVLYVPMEDILDFKVDFGTTAAGEECHCITMKLNDLKSLHKCARNNEIMCTTLKCYNPTESVMEFLNSLLDFSRSSQKSTASSQTNEKTKDVQASPTSVVDENPGVVSPFDLNKDLNKEDRSGKFLASKASLKLKLNKAKMFKLSETLKVEPMNDQKAETETRREAIALESLNISGLVDKKKSNPKQKTLSYGFIRRSPRFQKAEESINSTVHTSALAENKIPNKRSPEKGVNLVETTKDVLENKNCKAGRCVKKNEAASPVKNVDDPSVEKETIPFQVSGKTANQTDKKKHSIKVNMGESRFPVCTRAASITPESSPSPFMNLKQKQTISKRKENDYAVDLEKSPDLNVNRVLQRKVNISETNRNNYTENKENEAGSLNSGGNTRKSKKVLFCMEKEQAYDFNDGSSPVETDYMSMYKERILNTSGKGKKFTCQKGKNGNSRISASRLCKEAKSKEDLNVKNGQHENSPLVTRHKNSVRNLSVLENGGHSYRRWKSSLPTEKGSYWSDKLKSVHAKRSNYDYYEESEPEGEPPPTKGSSNAQKRPKKRGKAKTKLPMKPTKRVAASELSYSKTDTASKGKGIAKPRAKRTKRVLPQIPFIEPKPNMSNCLEEKKITNLLNENIIEEVPIQEIIPKEAPIFTQEHLDNGAQENILENPERNEEVHCQELVKYPVAENPNGFLKNLYSDNITLIGGEMVSSPVHSEDQEEPEVLRHLNLDSVIDLNYPILKIDVDANGKYLISQSKSFNFEKNKQDVLSTFQFDTTGKDFTLEGHAIIDRDNMSLFLGYDRENECHLENGDNEQTTEIRALEGKEEEEEEEEERHSPQLSEENEGEGEEEDDNVTNAWFEANRLNAVREEALVPNEVNEEISPPASPSAESNSETNDFPLTETQSHIQSKIDRKMSFYQAETDEIIHMFSEATEKIIKNCRKKDTTGAAKHLRNAENLLTELCDNTNDFSHRASRYQRCIDYFQQGCCVSDTKSETSRLRESLKEFNHSENRNIASFSSKLEKFVNGRIEVSLKNEAKEASERFLKCVALLQNQ